MALTTTLGLILVKSYPRYTVQGSLQYMQQVTPTSANTCIQTRYTICIHTYAYALQYIHRVSVYIQMRLDLHTHIPMHFKHKHKPLVHVQVLLGPPICLGRYTIRNAAPSPQPLIRGLHTRRQAVAQAIPKRESWWSMSSGECFDTINIIIEVERLDKVYLIFHFIRWATST